MHRLRQSNKLVLLAAFAMAIQFAAAFGHIDAPDYHATGWLQQSLASLLRLPAAAHKSHSADICLNGKISKPDCSDSEHDNDKSHCLACWLLTSTGSYIFSASTLPILQIAIQLKTHPISQTTGYRPVAVRYRRARAPPMASLS